VFSHASPISYSLTISLLLCVLGCQNQHSADTHPSDTHNGHDHAQQENDANHGHSTNGPHHGSIIELGSEEYHAEFLHNKEQQMVTIHILDGGVKNTVPIEAEEITINLVQNNEPQQFILSKSPVESDPPGKSSRFTSADEKLGVALHAEDSNVRLLVQIQGRSYIGTLTHEHQEHTHNN